jgi:hypothetical protein
VTDVSAAWQQALGTEYAAVFGYGVLGPRLAGDAVTLARACQQAHGDLADGTAAQLSASGLTPAEPAVDYPLPFPVTDAVAAQRLALRLETACAAAWRYLIAVAASSDTAAPARSPRSAAQSALTASAVRAMRWRRLTDPANATVAFPGIGD